MLRVDFTLRKGNFLLQPRFEVGDETVVIIGASGSGKTLTLKAIAGLVTPDAGEIILPGESVAYRGAEKINITPQQRGVGYVVQDLALFPHMNVRQNIEFALTGRSAEMRHRRATELIRLLGLEGTEDRRPGAISGGQQQRVALARALAREPRLLLLDEPFAALDTRLRETMRREILDLKRRLNLTLLFVTHDIEEAYTLADRIVAYHDGRAVQSDTRDEVFYRPATLEVAKLVGFRNFIPGRVIEASGGEVAVETPWFRCTVPRSAENLLRGESVFVCVRPEHILIPRDEHTVRDPRDTVLDARVVSDVRHPLHHSLVMAVGGTGDRSRLLLEIDVPSHPFALLHLAADDCRRIVLPFENMLLVRSA